MKKSLIAAAGATLAVAAMPAVGVFADGTFTDTVTVTVIKSCVFQAEWTQDSQQKTGDLSGRSFSATNVVPGTLLHFGGVESDDAGPAPGSSAATPIVKMECNTGNGQSGSGTWTVSAVGATEGGSITSMKPTASGTAIATGTATSGGTSNWAFKITGDRGSVAQGYTSYTSIPSVATPVFTGTADAGNDSTFTPAYQVYIGTNQEADTYTGKVTYTLSASNL